MDDEEYWGGGVKVFGGSAEGSEISSFLAIKLLIAVAPKTIFRMG
jgi:hypothetical protein